MYIREVRQSAENGVAEVRQSKNWGQKAVFHSEKSIIKNVVCDILRLRRVAIATFSAPPQCDPRGAFFAYQDNFNEISW